MVRNAGAFLIFILLLAACVKDSDDSTKPAILQFGLENDFLSPADVLIVSVQVADDEMLKQLKIRIRTSESKAFHSWQETVIEDISGKDFQQEYHFSVPDSAIANLYSVSLQVIDHRGNASIDSILDFTVFQPGLTPEFVNFSTEPQANMDGIIDIDTFGFLHFQGEVDDGAGISQLEISFLNSNGNVLLRDLYAYTDTIIHKWNFENNVDTVYFSSFSTIPSKVTIRAMNVLSHQGRKAYVLE